MRRDDLYLRNGIYWCRIRGPNGRKIRKSTGRRDKEAARLEKARLERFYADPAHAAAHSATLADALKAMLAATKAAGRAEGTLQMSEAHIGHIARVFGPESLLSVVTARTVDMYIEQRTDEGASSHTLHKELCSLRKALRGAKRRGEYPHDLSEIVPEFSARYVPRKTFLAPKQLEKLFGELAPDRAAHVAFVVATGARKGEALRAERGDIEGEFARLRGTKTALSARTVAVVGRFESLLGRALRGGHPKGRLFDPWGNAHRDIWAACDRAKIPRVSWNDLRRTFGSWLKQAGVSIDDIADQLGHSSTTMVRLVYGVDTPDALARRVRERLNGTKSAQRTKRKTPKRRK